MHVCHLGMLMCRGTRVEGGDGEERADRMRAVVHRAAVSCAHLCMCMCMYMHMHMYMCRCAVVYRAAISCAHLTTLLLELANAPGPG